MAREGEVRSHPDSPPSIPDRKSKPGKGGDLPKVSWWVELVSKTSGGGMGKAGSVRGVAPGGRGAQVQFPAL